jgi:uncharacterized membrane protein
MLAYLAGLLVYFSLRKSSKKDEGFSCLPGLYVVTVLFWGVLYSLVFIPFTAPDEYAHFSTAYRISNVLLGQEAVNEEGLVLVREDDARTLSISLDAEAYEDVYSRFFEKNENQEQMGYGYAAMEVANHAYIPQAIGITIGRICSLGQIPTIYLGRLCNLLFFVLCGYLAICLAPFGKLAFFGVSVLPMTLELVSSLSYDSFAIALAMLFTAYVMHLIWKVPKVGGKQLLILGILLALLAPCKMVYIPLALLCFLIPQDKFGSKKRFWIGAALVAVMMAGGILLVNLDKILVYVQETEETVDWADAAAGYSISYVMSHPLQVLGVLGRTIIQKGPTYVSTMLGGTLGWLEYRINPVITVFLTVWTILTGLFCMETERMGTAGFLPSLPKKHKLLSWFICLLVLVLTLLIMLLSWTPLSSLVVEGVQGRYFLPILPLALMTLPNGYVRVGGGSPGSATGYQAEQIERILVTGYAIANGFVLYGILATL